MSNVKLLLFLPVAAFVLVMARCKRHDCSKDIIPKVMIPQEVLDYVDFKAGTYWVYQDSATGRIDSEVVVSSRHYMQDVVTTNDCGAVAPTRQYENIEMIIQRYDSAGNKKESWIREFDNVNKMRDNRQDNMFIIDNYGSFEIGYPFNIPYYLGGDVIYQYKIDSVKINGIYRFDALKVESIFNYPPPDEHRIRILIKKLGEIEGYGIRDGKNYYHYFIKSFLIK